MGLAVEIIPYMASTLPQQKKEGILDFQSQRGSLGKHGLIVKRQRLSTRASNFTYFYGWVIDIIQNNEVLVDK